MVLWSRHFYGWILASITYARRMKALFDGMGVASIPIFREISLTCDRWKLGGLDTRTKEGLDKQACWTIRRIEERINGCDPTITSLKLLSSVWAGLVSMICPITYRSGPVEAEVESAPVPAVTVISRPRRKSGIEKVLPLLPGPCSCSPY